MQQRAFKVQFIFLIFFIHVIFNVTSIEFVFTDDQPKVYTGYLWERASTVHLSPRLQAVTKKGSTDSTKLCEINIETADGEASPFYTKVVDDKNGFADILISDKSQLNLRKQTTTIYYVKAYDCSNPPNNSEKIPLSIHVVTHVGPFFAQPTYTFTVTQQSPIGSVVGSIQAIQQLRDGEDPMTSAICDYRINPPNDMPFSIDKHGVIRVQGVLGLRKNDRPYIFQAVVEDCQRPLPRTGSVDVMVKLIKEGCQPGWKGLPNHLEYRGRADKPRLLLKQFQLSLDTCAGNCPEAAIRTRLELSSGLIGYTLKTASPDSCLHDPEQVTRQRLLCGMHTGTLTNLLPDPEHDIVSQLVGPSIGNPPRLAAPTMTWRFDASSMSVWEVDPKRLTNDEQTNAFDDEFTVTFWLRRFPEPQHAKNAKLEDKENTILCSQDKQESAWRFFSVSLQECRLIVRLMASFRYTAASLDTEPRKPTVWVFGPLPEQYCAPSDQFSAIWHHYAITFSRSPWGATSEVVSLLVDGQDLGPLGVPTETLLPSHPPYIPSEKKAQPKITVGACFDPSTRLTRQHMSAEISGLTVLLGRSESPNNLRCMAQCGESLLVPDVLKYLRSDISVNLESDAITVSGQNVTHIVDILKAIAYVRPQPIISPDYVVRAPQSRALTLTTVYRCSASEEVAIPRSSIQLNVFPEPSVSSQSIEVAQPLKEDSSSAWIPQDSHLFERPAIAQAAMEQKALKDSRKQGSTEIPAALEIKGSDIFIIEPPIGDPGVKIFADIRFVIPGTPTNTHTPSAASIVLLDSCVVWLVSAGDPDNMNSRTKLSATEDERIDWPVEEVLKLGLAGKNDPHGVHLTGRQTAGEYERVLRMLHYWPPKSLRSAGTSKNGDGSNTGEADVKYMATLGLICTMEAGKSKTSQLSVKVIVESPENAKVDISSNENIRRLSPGGHPQFAQSDMEYRRLSDGQLRPIEASKPLGHVAAPSRSSLNNKLMVASIAIAAVVVIVVLSLLLAFRARGVARTQTKPQQERRRRFAFKPADFGGSNLKHDPALRLTDNPIEEVIHTRLSTGRDDLFSSHLQLAPNQHIFSPPVHHKESEKSSSPDNARLADLEEFDEDYLDQADDEFLDPAEMALLQQSELDHPLVLNVNQTKLGSQLTTNVHGRHETTVYTPDIHEWIDGSPMGNEMIEMTQLRPGARKQNIVSYGNTKTSGNPPVNV